MPRTIVVVPCYNEASRLDFRTFEEFGRRHSDITLLLVNDGSRDATIELLEGLNARNPQRFHVLNLVTNRGKAEAVRQGFLRALDGNAQYVGFWDADLAAPLDDIQRFADVLSAKPHIELVVGTRMRLLGHQIERRPLRHWLGRLFARCASLVLGIHIFDTQCGAKLFRVTPRLAQTFARPFLARWIFDVEILARMALDRRGIDSPPLDGTIYEYPLDAWRDVAGSSVKSSDFLKAPAELAKIYWRYLRPGASNGGVAHGVPHVSHEGPPAGSDRGNQQRAA